MNSVKHTKMTTNSAICTTWCRALVLAILTIASMSAWAQQQTIPVYDENGGLGCMMVIDDIHLSKGVVSGKRNSTVETSKTSGTNEAIGLTLTLALEDNALPKTDMVTLTPRLFTTKDSVDFPAIRLYGKWAYLALQRSGDSTSDNYGLAGNPGDVLLPASDARIPLTYSQHLPFEQWMTRAQLKLIVNQTDGCCTQYLGNARVIGEQHMILSHREILKETAAQVNHLQGRAYINFAVNKTDIRPNLGNNRNELERLNSVLDSLRQVENMQIRHIYLKGYASPEGSYKHNDFLSRGRVEALRQYLADNYNVDSALISTENEPEDWEGLRDYVLKSNLADRKKILSIIDAPGNPDKKLKLIVQQHPEAYKQLLKVVFPLLRHTDYRIDYTLTKGQDSKYTEIATDTAYIYSMSIANEPITPAFNAEPRRFSPLLALKTNMLYDLALAPNIEVEFPLSRAARWSVMAEYTNPWWRWKKLDFSYQIQEGGLELRHWFSPSCAEGRPCLSGHFWGVYGAALKYDLEYDQTGNQGEIFSAGFTYGYSWPLSTHWNLELSASLGAAFGERRHYNAEFNSTHLIYKYTKNIFYVGPTKLKFSIVYLLGKKGGTK